LFVCLLVSGVAADEISADVMLFLNLCSKQHVRTCKV
jgi:hypothetical protein